MKDILASNIDSLVHYSSKNIPKKESEIEITSKTTSSTQDRKGSNIYDEKLISHEKQEYAGNTVDTDDKSKRANNPCYSNMFNRELTELESPK